LKGRGEAAIEDAAMRDKRCLLRHRLQLLATVIVLSTVLPILLSFFNIHTTFVVLSDSMSPTINPGDFLLTYPVNGETANGTIIVFKSPLGGYEAHRVIGNVTTERGVFYLTRGDANNQEDSFLVAERNVVGVLSFVIPVLGSYFLIPREIALTATLVLIGTYFILTFRVTDTRTIHNSTSPQKMVSGKGVVERKVASTCLLLSILVLSTVISVKSSVNLTYPYADQTISIALPLIVLQQGNAGSSTINDGGNQATVMVTANNGTVPWLTGWSKRVMITIDHNDITSSLSNFPLLVYLSNSSGRDKADVSFIFDRLQNETNRMKIAVTQSDGTTQCYVEIERWDHANRQAWLWVKVPTVNNTTDTNLYLYYDVDHVDNTAYVGDLNSAPAEGVWDSNFVAVYHMAQTPTGTIYDSTSNSVDLSSYGSMTASNLVNGVIGKALSFDGSNDRLDSSKTITFESFTFEAWAKADTWSGWRTVIAPDGDARDFCTNVGKLTFWDGLELTIGPTLSGTNWKHLVARYDDGASSNRLRGFVNGSITSQTANPSYAPLTGVARIAAVLYSGSYVDFWDGTLDEVRVSKTPRSAAWIKASYESERDDLLAFGNDETEHFDYVLKVFNAGSNAWTMFLSKSSDSNLGRLSNMTIWFHDGEGVSRQIQVINGSYTQTSGSSYNLFVTGTVYIAVACSSSSAGNSTIVVKLKAMVLGSGVSEELQVTFNIY